MQSVLTFLANPSVRRFLVSMLAIGIAALNKRLGLNLEAGELFDVVLVALGYVGQSAAKEAMVAHADAKTALAEAMKPVAANPSTPPAS